MTNAKRLDLIVTISAVVTIVAVGIVGASFIPADDGAAVSAVDTENSEIKTKPVEYPVDIPGCDQIELPPEGDSIGSFSSTFVGERSYDNPAFPWMTSTKAAAMSYAVREALPSDVDIALAAPSLSLTFGPVEDFGDSDFDPVSSATTELTRAGVTAFMSIGVSASETGVPPCVVGDLDRRETASDGTVVDTVDTWYEIDGVRTYSRSATAYHPDGTRVSVYVSGGSNPVLPLESDEAARIAALPALATSTPAPIDTPALRSDCSVYPSDNGSVRDIRPDAVDAANAALTESWAKIPDAPVLERPIGSLIPSGFGSGVCTDLDVVGTTISLSISIVGGQPLPQPPDPYDPSNYGQLPETRTLEDGSVLQFVDSSIMYMSTSDDGTGRLSRSVTVTRPSGVQISARSSVDAAANGPAPMVLPEPLPVEVLDVIANTQIEQWP